MIRAFNTAKTYLKADTAHGNDFVSRGEFRILLKYLRIYFEYWVAFARIDTNADKKISFEEFTAAKPALERWGIDMSNPEKAFSEADKFNGGKGSILFDEFCNWAMRKGLDLDDDDDTI